MSGYRSRAAALCFVVLLFSGLINVAAAAAPVITSFNPLSGPAFGPIQIAGSGFTGTTAVRIGTQVVPYVVESDGAIRADLVYEPSDPPYSGPVTVVTPEGTAVSESQFTESESGFPGFQSMTPTAGAVGSLVTIYGWGFDATTQVFFNGVRASTPILTRSQLRAIVPDGATSGRVTVTNASGQLLTPMTFGVGVLPVISDFSPKGGSIGTLVRLTGSGFTGASAVQFTGKYVLGGRAPVSAPVYSVSENELYTTVPGGMVDSGPLTVVGPNGIRGSSSGRFAICGAPASISTHLRICATEIATANVGLVEGATYSWTITNGTILSGETTSVITYQASGAGPVTLSVEQSVEGCPVSRGSRQVEVGPPTAKLLALDSICAGGTGSVSAEFSSVPSVPPVLEWSITNGEALSPTDSQFFSFSAGPSGQVTIALTATLCGVRNLVATKTISIDVPTPVIAMPEIVRVGNMVYASVGHLPSATYSWAVVGGTVVGSQSEPTFRFTADSRGIATVSVTVTVCGRSATASKTIRAVIPEITSFAPTSGPVGTVIDVHGQDLVGAQGASIRIPFGGGPLELTVIDDSHVRVKVLEGAKTGRISIATAGGEALSQRALTVCGSPLFLTQTFAQCPGGTATIELPDMIGATYQWTATNAEILSPSDVASITYRPLDTGEMRFTARVVDGCGTVHDLSTVVPLTQPGPALTAPTFACPNTGIVVSGSSYPGASWNVINGVITGTSGNLVSVLVPSSGTVTVQRLAQFCPGVSTVVSSVNIPIGPPQAAILVNDVVAPGATALARAPLFARATYHWQVAGGTLLSPASSPYATFTAATSGPTTLTLIVSGCSGSTTATKILGASNIPAIHKLSPIIGSSAGGEDVTITGSDLGLTTGVSFGGAAATIVSVAVDRVIVRTPQIAASLVDVTLTTAGGTATSPGAFRFVDPVTAVTPPSAEPVTVTAGAAALTFSGITTAGVTSVTQIDPLVAGTVPQSFLAGDFAYEISTTAAFTGPIVIAFHLPDVSDEVVFNSLRVLHRENGILVDRTVLAPDAPERDFAQRLIYARVTSLSPFVIARSRAPHVLSTAGPSAATLRGTPAELIATFQDIESETHTAEMAWGDGTVSPGVVIESGRTGTVRATHTYAAAGLYEVTVTVTDPDAFTGSGTYRALAVYDPAAGSLTAGGWIAHKAGKLNLSCNAKYEKSGSLGGTFTFDVGAFKLRSKSLDWMVVSGAGARVAGTAALDGAGEVTFSATFIDGARAGDGVDRVRVVVTKADGDVVFDSAGGPVGTLTRTATTALGGGDVTIHK